MNITSTFASRAAAGFAALSMSAFLLVASFAQPATAYASTGFIA